MLFTSWARPNSIDDHHKFEKDHQATRIPYLVKYLPKYTSCSKRENNEQTKVFIQQSFFKLIMHIRTCMHTFKHTYTHTYMHARTHTCMCKGFQSSFCKILVFHHLMMFFNGHFRTYNAGLAIQIFRRTLLTNQTANTTTKHFLSKRTITKYTIGQIDL